MTEQAMTEQQLEIMPRPYDRVQIEAALDSGRLELLMGNGAWWKVRRNGKTRTWKRDRRAFRIPIKYGFYGTGYIDEKNMGAHCLRVLAKSLTQTTE